MTAENINTRILFLKEKENDFKRRTFETSTTMHEKQDPNAPDLQVNWPKIVEYAGLSEYEAKVYLSLIGLGSSGARKLSINCKVPRTKVYGTLKKLVDFGLVIEIPGVPKCFTPTSPLNGFGSTVKRTLNKALDFSMILESLVDTHETSMKEASPQQKTLWYIDSDDDIISKFHEIVRQAKETLEVVASADGLTLFFNSAPNLLDQMQNIGVDVKIFSPLDPKANPLARELSYLFDVRKVDISSPLLFVDSDHKSFILARIKVLHLVKC
ncbi:hypothetical protein DRO27_02105 [Candidatus Bathyarchaeota archaeon]|nr:MAG: hypothetical protein DRO27_02105 [Candidatus Bathyarchaeota archaeon]